MGPWHAALQRDTTQRNASPEKKGQSSNKKNKRYMILSYHFYCIYMYIHVLTTKVDEHHLTDNKERIPSNAYYMYIFHTHMLPLRYLKSTLRCPWSPCEPINPSHR